MPFPTRLIGIFAFIFLIIFVIPLLLIGSHTVATKNTESLGIAGLMEGMQKNYIVVIILFIIAISVTTIWAVVIFNITPK